VIIFGRSMFSEHCFGGPGLVPRQSQAAPLSVVFTSPPVPAPPRSPLTTIFTQRRQSEAAPLTTIIQGRHKLVLDIVNADSIEGGNPIYEKELTL
jgi:hypothetical protein